MDDEPRDSLWARPQRDPHDPPDDAPGAADDRHGADAAAEARDRRGAESRGPADDRRGADARSAADDRRGADAEAHGPAGDRRDWIDARGAGDPRGGAGEGHGTGRAHDGWAPPRADLATEPGWRRPTPADAAPSAPAPSFRRHAEGGAALERFESLADRATAARYALVFVAVTSVVAIVGDLLELRLVERLAAGAAIGTDEADANLTRQSLVGLLQITAAVTAAVMVIRWTSLAYRGLDALGAERRFHTGWAIGGWLVPILNLWRPKQVANDLWAAGRVDGDPPHSTLLLLWWAAFVAYGLLGYLAARLSLRANTTLAEDQAYYGLSVVTSVVGAVGALLGVAVVVTVTRRLHRRAGLPAA